MDREVNIKKGYWTRSVANWQECAINLYEDPRILGLIEYGVLFMRS